MIACLCFVTFEEAKFVLVSIKKCESKNSIASVVVVSRAAKINSAMVG